jgi:hypothetical protein
MVAPGDGEQCSTFVAHGEYQIKTIGIAMVSIEALIGIWFEHMPS